MNKRQKATLINCIVVITITVIGVVVMINFKDWVNRSEAMRAMEQLGRIALKYRQTHGSVPPEYYVDSIRGKLEGNVRLGNLHYRALWIDFEATEDEILAYVEKDYHSFIFGHGFVVLRLDGHVEWMKKKQFDILMAQQQSPMEIEMLRKK